MTVTADTITDEQIQSAIEWSNRGRQNAHTRSLRNDAHEALKGNRACREAVVSHIRHYAASSSFHGLEDAIERYLGTDWSYDSTRLGALNAVAYIGERVAETYRARCAEILNARKASQ